MTDETTPARPAPGPAPENAPTREQPAVADPEPDAATSSGPAAYGPAPAPRSRWGWTSRRVPLLAAAGLLIVGCLCGAGGVAVAALIGGHQDGRSHSEDSRRFDGPAGDRGDRGGRGFGRDGGPRGNPAPVPADPANPAPANPAPANPAPPTVAPSTVAPAPSAT